MKKSLGEKIFIGLDSVLMFFLCVICIYPLYYCLVASFSDPFQLSRIDGILLAPAGWSTSAYKLVLGNKELLNGYKNTLFIVVVGVTINLIMTTLAAYVLSRKNVLWRNLIMMMIVVTMYFSGGLIPTYLVVRAYGFYDSLWALIIPTAMSAYNMIIMRTYMASIHDSLSESAMIDGANHFTILTRIFIPLCKPSVAVMVLYYGVGHWNAWFNANIYLSSSSKFPLQLVLRNLLIRGSTLDMTRNVASSDYDAVIETIKHASVIVSTLPILVIYPLLQKYFVGGIMIGSIKE